MQFREPPRQHVFMPFYFITGPGSKKKYYGAIVWDGTKPQLKALIKEFYEGEPLRLRIQKIKGSYEARDARILRRMGLHYQARKTI